MKPSWFYSSHITNLIPVCGRQGVITFKEQPEWKEFIYTIEILTFIDNLFR